MTKVYIVEKGQCQDGDHHTCGVFSSQDNAQAFIDLGGGESYYEYEVDAEMKLIQSGLSAFKIFMDKEGPVDKILKVGLFAEEEIDIDVRYIWDKGHCSMVVHAKDEQQATDIAIERRNQLIASGAWDKIRESNIRMAYSIALPHYFDNRP